MAKNSQLGIPEFSGERRFNETGDEFTGVYEFKDKNRQKHFRLHKTGIDRLDSKEVKTVWHSEMQARFIRLDPKFKLEVHYQGLHDNRRQADIVYDDRVCIELQYSNISRIELEERTKDALHRFDKIIWIFYHSSMIPQSARWLAQSSIPKPEIDKNGFTLQPIGYKEEELFEEVQDFLRRWGKHGVTIDCENLYRGTRNKHDWEINTCFGAEIEETVYFRTSTAPVYMYLKTLPNVYEFRGHTIKEYKENVSHPSNVSILFHYYEQCEDEEPWEIFHKLEKGLTRGEAKTETNTYNLQSGYSFVSKHTTLCWDRLCFNEIGYNPYNARNIIGYLHDKNNT